MTSYQRGYVEALAWIRAMISMLARSAAAEPPNSPMALKLEATGDICAELIRQIDQQSIFIGEANGGTH